ncbi:MAG: hypothetical protein MJ237_01720 [bacterium]|nr:hypothetical protein [bacterium]
MTKTQIRNDNNIKEGVIVNSYVKDPLLSLDETLDTLVISETKIDLPQKFYEKDVKKNNKLVGLSIASVGTMGLIGVFTALIKNFSKKKYESCKEYLLPGLTRNHCINNEIDQSIFSMIQSPNRRTIIASIGVISLASMAFIAKNFIDGVKEVWVKSQEANIQKNLQENLIAVETQSFSGKIQIIRSMLSDKANDFVRSLKEVETANIPVFTGKNENNKQGKNSGAMFFALAGLTLLSVFGVGYIALKNLKKSDEFIKKSLENTKKGLDNVIQDFNNKKPIEKIEDNFGHTLVGDNAYKHLIERLLESIYAKPDEIEQYVNKMNLKDVEKKKFINELKSSMNQATEKVNSAIGGSGRNKITYFSHVNDYLSFFYDWLMNPNNPQFKNLFLGITSVAAVGYCGKVGTEAIKEVEVKKYNADIELNLQKRLVATELRNFKSKKDSVIEPLCEEFYKQKEDGKSADKLKVVADNILFEIKNGPPFVYS